MFSWFLLTQFTNRSRDKVWASYKTELLSVLYVSAIEEVNDMLRTNTGYREVRSMGWLSEQVHVSGDSSHVEWKPVFVALTEKDMLLYEAAPWSREDWSGPYMSHPLLATR